MPFLENFDLDASGNVILKPVMGWRSGPVAEIAVLLQIQYADNDTDIETGGRSIQFVLTPQQCQQLAELLKKQANRVLGMPSEIAN